MEKRTKDVHNELIQSYSRWYNQAEEIPGQPGFFIELVLYTNLEFSYNNIVNKTTDKQGGQRNDYTAIH